MAYCKPEVFWKKGQSGNPKGRPPVKRELKNLKEQLKDDLEKYINELMKMELSQLKAIVEDKTGQYTSFKQILASILYRAGSKGDPMRMDAILNRVIGKVKDEVEVRTDQSITVNFGFPRPERKE